MPHVHARGFPSPCCDRGGQAPALKKTFLFIVGRGPVPRHRAGTCNPTLAGETRSDARVASEGPALR